MPSVWEPLVVYGRRSLFGLPPPALKRTATDIAFAASVVLFKQQIWLYYSLGDTRLYRAIIRRS